MTSSNHAVFDLLVIRRLAGEATVAEKQQLQRLRKSKAGKARFADLQQVWAATKEPQSSGFNVRAAIKLLSSRIVRPKQIAKSRKKP